MTAIWWKRKVFSGGFRVGKKTIEGGGLKGLEEDISAVDG